MREGNRERDRDRNKERDRKKVIQLRERETDRQKGKGEEREGDREIRKRGKWRKEGERKMILLYYHNFLSCLNHYRKGRLCTVDLRTI